MKRLGPLFGATALTATLVLQGCGTGTGELVVKVRADTLSLRVNETVQLIAEGQKGSDTVALGTVTYSTSDQTVADVDPNTGLVSAKGTGTATLTATSEGRSGQLSISVAGAAHRGNIRASETWRAKDNPHSVLERVDVEGSTHPVVTLEPGVIVRFTAHTGLYVGTGGEPGSLEAEGTAQAPIQFVADTASPTPGFWQGLIFGAQCGVDSVLRQAKLTHCGADPELAGSSNPCIRIVGGNTRPVIADVSIQNSGGSGVEALEDAGFGDGSARVSVSDSAGYPFLIEPNQAHTLPTGGTLSNNAPNMVYIFDGPVLDTQSWPLLGVPYVAGGGINIGGPNSPMLTLPAGLELRFTSGGSLWVGNDEPGGLIAEGTASAPIRFVAHSSAPAAGFWGSLYFFEQRLTTTSLKYALVDDSGGSNVIAGPDAAITVFGDTNGAFIQHTTLSHSGACGIRRDTTDAYPTFPTDFTAPELGNQFLNDVGADQCSP